MYKTMKLRFLRRAGLLGLVIILGLATGSRAAARDITIEDLVELRDIQVMVLSPNGKYIAFQTTQRLIDSNSLVTKWHIAATQPDSTVQTIDTGTEPVMNKFAGYFLGSDIVWSPDSEWVYFTKKSRDDIQIWRGSLRAPEAQQVTHADGDVLSMQIPPAGTQVYFTVGRSHAEIETLEQQGAREGYLQQYPPLYYFSIGPLIPTCTDGKERYELANRKFACRVSNWIYDEASGTVRPATPAELDALPVQDDSLKTIALMGVQLSKSLKKMQTASPDGKKLAWIENEDPEVYKGVFPPMILSAHVDGQTIRCPAVECIDQDLVGFGGIWWNPNGKEIIFKVKNDPYHSVTAFYGWTPGEKGVRTISLSEDLFSDCQLTEARLICEQESWTSPRKVAALDLISGKTTTIADVNPEFKDIGFTRVEKIPGEDTYGHKVYGHLVYPKGYVKGQRYPLIVTQYHSYGFLRGATGGEQPIHAYARDGFAVLSLDHRLNTAEYQKTSVYPGTNLAHFRYLLIEQGPATAIENMVDELVKRGIADPERIGVTGFSYGDQVLSTALMRRNYAAASSGGLPSVPVNHLMAAPGATATAYNDIFGKPFTPQGLEMRVKYSLAAHAHEINTPILMQVTDRESPDFQPVYNALNDGGRVVEMYIYPDELHIKWQPVHKDIIYHRNLDWFNFWLQDRQDPDPEKSAQYERWHELRALLQANLQAAAEGVKD